ncbi:hypothetical protein GIB67_037921 [Kingdonia uniflora]|uniref:C3H1-type domain-containing protein n=1 Tax=Kingdonia uniflora TaxID=39325 RepID=A0A7J7LH42_9MAGN|nr:hypothetical protein GIB67_037921 [Kingdonia uniflora]
MSSVCGENHHHSHSLFTPQKLLTHRSNLPISITPHQHSLQHHYFIDEDVEEETDPYETAEFRMYEFKIRRCMRSRSHDWTDCPFAHPGEKARRRDPRRFHYSGNSCADFRRGSCPRGDSCEFAHGVFECWLHPARYRTQLCKDGRGCKRKVCFFAHTTRELRILSPGSSSGARDVLKPCGCSFCRTVVASASSPTSTLMGFPHHSPPLSPTNSPPLSPTDHGYSLLSRFNEALVLKARKPAFLTPDYLSYKSVLMELVSSLKAMDLTSTSISGDFSCFSPTLLNHNVVVEEEEEQEHFHHVSPCSSLNPNDDEFGSNGGHGPDLNWVDELVM